MLIEAAAAILLGIGVLWMVFQPFVERAPDEPEYVEPPELEETARGQALIALKEIEFDRETGKLSDGDYAMLKARYTERAIEAMRQEEGAAAPAPADVEGLIAARVERLRAEGGGVAAAVAVSCPTCGPRPEVDALWCSTCGEALPGVPRCRTCRGPMDPGASFCASCGAAA